MGRFFDALRAGVAGFKEGAGPTEYSVGGRPVRCPQCGHTLFAEGSALLATKGRTFLELAWTNPSATILVCAECSRIEWFAKEPDRAADKPGP